jgi:hypothetical protein
VVGLRQLAALVDVGVGVGVVTAGGDGVVVVVEVLGRVSSSSVVVTAEGSGVGAEFERTTKMECENGCKNDHFCKSEGRVRFFKNDHFSVHFRLILKFIFEKWKKNETENEPKMARKWLL